jgi:hypothetical protein
MAQWLKLRANGGFVNLDLVARLEPTFVGSGDFAVQVGTGVYLEGSYASLADAQDAARKISQGLDPSTLI